MPAKPQNLTIDEAVQRLQEITGQLLRLSAPGSWNIPAILQALRGAGPVGVPKGSCLYVVNGQVFCVDGITEIECSQLGGSFSTSPCSVRHGEIPGF
jgi:hypothetical protein